VFKKKLPLFSLTEYLGAQAPPEKMEHCGTKGEDQRMGGAERGERCSGE